jgi:hypothetical protein
MARFNLRRLRHIQSGSHRNNYSFAPIISHTNRSIHIYFTMFRLIIALALVATASAAATGCADVPAPVTTDCTAAGALGTTCQTSTVVTDVGGDKITTGTTLCTIAAGCTAGTAGTVVTTCVADSTTCMVGIVCSGAGALQISTFAVMFSLIAAFYQL